MQHLHSLLWRQLKKHVGDGDAVPPALTKQFIDLHGRSIWAESERVGKGSASRFVIFVSQSPGHAFSAGEQQ
jgi:signal transduction histidine kinase